MALTYLAIICKSRKYNIAQWYGGGGRGGGREKGGKKKEKKKDKLLYGCVKVLTEVSLEGAE